VFPRTAAYYAGLRPGDVITSVNGLPILTLDELALALQRGTASSLTVTRNGQSRQLDLMTDDGSIRTATRPGAALPAGRDTVNQIDRSVPGGGAVAPSGPLGPRPNTIPTAGVTPVVPGGALPPSGAAGVIPPTGGRLGTSGVPPGPGVPAFGSAGAAGGTGTTGGAGSTAGGAGAVGGTGATGGAGSTAGPSGGTGTGAAGGTGTGGGTGAGGT
jgi:hypothetical protein